MHVLQELQWNPNYVLSLYFECPRSEKISVQIFDELAFLRFVSFRKEKIECQGRFLGN